MSSLKVADPLEMTLASPPSHLVNLHINGEYTCGCDKRHRVRSGLGHWPLRLVVPHTHHACKRKQPERNANSQADNQASVGQ